MSKKKTSFTTPAFCSQTKSYQYWGRKDYTDSGQAKLSVIVSDSTAEADDIWFQLVLSGNDEQLSLSTIQFQHQKLFHRMLPNNDLD